MKIKSSKIYPPFAWVGGKRKLADIIISKFPQYERYIEVFGGGLAVLYAKPILTCQRCVEVANDFNGDLINLHTQIRNRPETLSILLNQLLPSRSIFNKIKSGEMKPRNNIEKAVFYLYLLTYSFGSKGESFAMAKGKKPKSIVRNFSVWSRRLKRVHIENLSFDKLISEYDHEKSLFYLDPPYFETEKYYSNSNFSKDDHIILRDSLANISGKFILSYNNSEFIRELYKDFNIDEVSTNYSLNAKSKNRNNIELIITNY